MNIKKYDKRLFYHSYYYRVKLTKINYIRYKQAENDIPKKLIKSIEDLGIQY